MRRINFKIDSRDSAEINISPMIDMVFILLIFFIVTTVFIDEQGLDVKVPQPANISVVNNEIIQFKITANGQVLYEGKNIGIGGVGATVSRIMSKEKIPLILEVESKSKAGLLVKVMDAAKIAGVETISVNRAAE